MEAINHEYYVSHEVTKLLEGSGFDWKEYLKPLSVYDGGGSVWKIPLHIAQRWLREVKNCYVGVEVFVHDLDKNNIYYTYNWVVYFNGDRYSGSDTDTTRYYEVAQGTGIKKALKIILEEGE